MFLTLNILKYPLNIHIRINKIYVLLGFFVVVVFFRDSFLKKSMCCQVQNMSHFTFMQNSMSVSKFCYFKGALSSLRQFLATESSLEMMENTFHFTLKAFFFVDSLVMQEKRLIRKIKLISKFGMSQPL